MLRDDVGQSVLYLKERCEVEVAMIRHVTADGAASTSALTSDVTRAPSTWATTTSSADKPTASLYFTCLFHYLQGAAKVS